MRGGFSNEIAKLRGELLNFASLIELELDFAEEDVEFADRTQFKELLNRIEFVLKRLIDSFAVGNVIKNGIPVAIVGEPNVGKSTLLNALSIKVKEVEEYMVDLETQIKTLEEKKQALRDKLLGKTGVTTTGYEIKWSTVQSNIIDKEAVEKALGFVPMKQGKESARLSVKKTGDK